MPTRKLPLPQSIDIDGKTLTLYRDYDGEFVSKADYLKLQAQSDEVREKTVSSAEPEPDRVATETLKHLVELIESRLPLFDGLLTSRPLPATSSTSPDNRSGGADVNAEKVDVGGDITGHDKLNIANGDIASRDVNKPVFAPTEGPPPDPAREAVRQLIEHLIATELPAIDQLLQQLSKPTALPSPPLPSMPDPLRSATTDLVDRLTRTDLPWVEQLLTGRLTPKPEPIILSQLSDADRVQHLQNIANNRDLRISSSNLSGRSTQSGAAALPGRVEPRSARPLKTRL